MSEAITALAPVLTSLGVVLMIIRGLEFFVSVSK